MPRTTQPRMHKIIFVTLFSLLSAILSGCSGPDSFAVKGHVKGDATINLRALYYVDGALQSSIFPADRGSFAFKGRAPEGAVVEILDNDYRLLGRFYAVNGDEIDVTIDPKSPASAKVNKGSDIAVRWAQWLNANAKTIDSRNSKIINALAAKYVKAHPQDIVSTLIITTVYDASVDPEGASRLLSSIAPEARPTALTEAMATLLMYADTNAAKRRVSPLTLMAQGDTVTTFSPRKHRLSLLVFSDENSGRADSIVPALRRLRKAHTDKALGIMDVSLDADTLAWLRSTRNDTATWDAAWGKGGIASAALKPLAIPRIPYFIVTDSVGSQIYRGASISQALKKIDK